MVGLLLLPIVACFDKSPSFNGNGWLEEVGSTTALLVERRSFRRRANTDEEEEEVVAAVEAAVEPTGFDPADAPRSTAAGFGDADVRRPTFEVVVVAAWLGAPTCAPPAGRAAVAFAPPFDGANIFSLLFLLFCSLFAFFCLLQTVLTRLLTDSSPKRYSSKLCCPLSKKGLFNQPSATAHQTHPPTAVY